MEKVKLFKITIVVLIIINIVTIATMWFGKPKHHKPLPHDRGMSFLSEELGMKGANKEKLDAMETKHHTEKRELLEKNKQLRVKLFDLLKAEANDTNLVNQFVSAIIVNQKQIELMTFYHFKEVKNMCSLEQQIKLEETIKEAIRMAGGKPPKK